MQKILIYTATFNRLDLTKQWLPELQKKHWFAENSKTISHDGEFEILHIVVDNGSKDGTPEWLQEHKDELGIEVITNTENVGIVAAWIQAYQKAKDLNFEPDFFVKYDDDCEIITTDTIWSMAKFAIQTNGQYCCAPVDLGIHPDYVPQSVDQTKEILNWRVRKTTHIGGMLALYPAEFFKEIAKVGGIQRDICRGTFAIENGWGNIYLLDLQARHQGNEQGTVKDFYKF